MFLCVAFYLFRSVTLHILPVWACYFLPIWIHYFLLVWALCLLPVWVHLWMIYPFGFFKVFPLWSLLLFRIITLFHPSLLRFMYLYESVICCLLRSDFTVYIWQSIWTLSWILPLTLCINLFSQFFGFRFKLIIYTRGKQSRP